MFKLPFFLIPILKKLFKGLKLNVPEEQWVRFLPSHSSKVKKLITLLGNKK